LSIDKVEKHLCAYIVSDEKLAVSDLRECLSRELPAYMIPSYFMQIENIPLTPNGKVDRRALPLLEPIEMGDHTEPQNEMEKKLVDVWSEVLKIEKNIIGIDGNFFDLGGESLKSTILIAEIHKKLDVKLSLADVFEKPTIRGLAAFIGEAEENKYSALAPAEKKEYYALSSAQKRLYVLHQIDGDSIGYNMPQVIPLETEPDMEMLKQTFDALIERHDSLRTSFKMAGEQPVQVVHNPDEIDFQIEYLMSGVAGIEPEGNSSDKRTALLLEVEQIIKSFVRAFDLSQAPLLRVGLIKAGIEEYVLVVDLHHIICDAVSRRLLAKDFMSLYAGEELLALRLQYKDYAEWQASRMQIKTGDSQEQYWLKELEGEIPVLHLPTDYLRPAIQGFEGNTVNFEISKEETSALNRMALEKGGTMFMVLMAVTNIFLSKLSGQNDIIVGTPIAGRGHADLEKIIGMLVNTLALRNFPVGEKKFETFLLELKERTLKAFENQDYQFEDLVDKAAVVRDAGRNPLFDVMFSFYGTDSISAKEPGKENTNVKQNQYKYESNIAKFDLSLDVLAGERLFCSFQYSTKLFKRETIRRWVGYFKKIISTVIALPGIALAEIEIISEEEKKLVLIEFNKTDAQYPVEKTIPDLFEAQATGTPGKIAVVFDNSQLTYHELNRKAGQLAVLLRNRGVTPETIVAILVDRSLEMIVGVTAVQKAGGAFLPLDPSYPLARIEYMIRDSSAALLISRGGLEFQVDFSGPVIDIDAFQSEYRAGGVMERNLKPGDLAYLIYTSGSTGNPKGVMVQNNHYANMAWAWREIYRLEEMEVNLLQIAAFSFDVFAGDLVRALLNGGKLVICPEEVRLDPESLYRLMRTHRISIFESTPALIIPFMEYVYENQLAVDNLDLLILGSDICLAEDFRKLVSRFSDRVKIVNSYGVTETTIDATYYEASPENVLSSFSGNVPIGRPLPNVKLYIAGEGNKLQPVGVPGELHIGGKSVARGYRNNLQLTRERFLPNPFNPGENVYKTGDMARWLPDGNVEFLGRLDNQVKIRGYRIELG
ncbi:MAG: amino acid adenylation domain-containing protein, partial [bacterium]|nr:amino acid adenylation domain-containing protein [bacterium]